MAYCVICERPVTAWLPHPQRDQLGQFTRLLGAVGSDLDLHLCPNCHCNDRERHLWLYMRVMGLTERIGTSRILHIAPEVCLETLIRARGPSEYVLGDLAPRRPGHRALNVESLCFDDGAFDLILCNHVLEHVADPAAALGELARCLHSEGHLIAQTPYVPALKWTFELEGKASPQFAKLMYGQEDHVRLFGADLTARFHAAGFSGELLPHQRVLGDLDPAEYGCNVREPFFLFSKSECPAYPS
jgi:SAM-dependent methyltransferase